MAFGWSLKDLAKFDSLAKSKKFMELHSREHLKTVRLVSKFNFTSNKYTTENYKKMFFILRLSNE